MKRIALFLSFCIILSKGTIYAQHPATDQNWNTIFHDNFTTLNNNLWRIINNESHYMYIDEANIYKLICDKNTIVNEIYDYDSYNYAVKKSITLSNSSSLSIGQNISLKATDFIELNQGFEVPLGSQLYLETTPCE